MSNTVHAKAVELCKHVLKMTTRAGSGHPSSATSLAHIVVELMYHQMRHDPSDPWNPRNDRLVLSEGHAVPIIYAAYADQGGLVGKSPDKARPLKMDDLSTLRQLNSVLDGHPNPAEGFPFFDAATGSLGQGLSVAAGLALAARRDKSDKRVFVLIGDGESREGQVWEAMDFIAENGLTRVCAIFNCNGQGQADLVSKQQSPESLKAKVTAFGWEAVTVNGHDPQLISSVLSRAGKEEKPLAVIARTVKGWGVDILQSGNYHGKPLTKDELETGLEQLDTTLSKLDPDADMALKPPPSLPTPPSDAAGVDEATAVDQATVVDQAARKDSSVAPRTSKDVGELPSVEEAFQAAGLESALKTKKLATRVAYGAALVALGHQDERVVCFDADVSNSTYAEMFKKAFPDRFFECKIGEQNMISAAVGAAAAGKIPFASSFAKFITRAYDQIEMASISRANLKIVGSHSGVSLGADGPSQMSLCDLTYFRSMTRADDGRGGRACYVFQPSDAVCAYRCVEWMARTRGLCYMRTHRPEAPFLYPLDETFSLGACKQLRQGHRLTLVSSGFMLHTVLRAAESLEKEGITCNVFDAYAFPFDATPILDAAQRAEGAILTVEDNYIGGLYSEIAEAAGETGAARVKGLTCARIPKSALTADEVFRHVGVGLEQILETAHKLAATPSRLT